MNVSLPAPGEGVTLFDYVLPGDLIDDQRITSRSIQCAVPDLQNPEDASRMRNNWAETPEEAKLETPPTNFKLARGKPAKRALDKEGAIAAREVEAAIKCGWKTKKCTLASEQPPCQRRHDDALNADTGVDENPMQFQQTWIHPDGSVSVVVAFEGMGDRSTESSTKTAAKLLAWPCTHPAHQGNRNRFKRCQLVMLDVKNAVSNCIPKQYANGVGVISCFTCFHTTFNLEDGKYDQE